LASLLPASAPATADGRRDARSLVARAAELKRACDKPKATACYALGDLLAEFDLARAPRLHVVGHRVRGLPKRELPDSVSHAVEGALRYIQHRYDPPERREPKPPPPGEAKLIDEAASKLQVRVGKTTLDGPYPQESLGKVYDKLRPSILRCYAKGALDNPALQGRVMLRFTIEPTGDPFRIGGGGDVPDGGVISCVTALFYGVPMPPHPGPAVVVEQDFHLSPKR
jgi:hypothetical protein